MMYELTTAKWRQTANRVGLAQIAAALMLAGTTLLAPSPMQASDWTDTIDFTETGFPTVDSTLQEDSGTQTLTYDIFTGDGLPGTQPLSGSDGTVDLTLDIKIVKSSGNTWGTFVTPNKLPKALYRQSNSDLASDFTITNNTDPDETDCSKENDWAYVKYDFEFSGALSSIQSGQFVTTHLSPNGPSLAYEYTIVTINGNQPRPTGGLLGVPLNTLVESRLQTYDNINHFSVGETMSEHILSITDGDGINGGNMEAGLWAADDFNTQATVNPTKRSVSMNGNFEQKISGAPANDLNNLTPSVAGDENFGLSETDIIAQVTYYFGLHDVALETTNIYRNDTCTNITHTGGANVASFTIGYEEPTAIELATLNAQSADEGTLLTWTTAAEIDNAGFNILGGPSDTGPWTKLNKSLIAAKGTPSESASYSYMDESGTAYFMLEDVDLKGAITRHGPVSPNRPTIGSTTIAPSTSSAIYLPFTYQQNQ